MSAPYDHPPRMAQEDKPLSELLSDLTGQLSQLVRKEVELAATEIKQEARRAAKAGGMLGAAGLAGYVCLLLLSFALAWALSEVIPIGFAFLLVALLWGIGAAVLGAAGKKRLEHVNPTPEQTIETFKEDAAWVKNRRS